METVCQFFSSKSEVENLGKTDSQILRSFNRLANQDTLFLPLGGGGIRSQKCHSTGCFSTDENARPAKRRTHHHKNPASYLDLTLKIGKCPIIGPLHATFRWSAYSVEMAWTEDATILTAMFPCF
jgi:hypothetical protein